MFGLVAGGLGVTMMPEERGRYLAHFARPGAWFGEEAAFTRQSRRVGLVAARDTEILRLPLGAIRQIVGKNPTAWRLFGLVTIRHL
jgi:CRP/FNR family transcriptional regulator, cyclic AMP receptor protein